MSDYRAPVRDMRFVLEHIADLEGLSRLEGFDHAEPELVGQILEEAAKFAGGVLAPLNRIGDQQGAVWDNGAVRTPDGFADAYHQFAAAGWNGMPFDPDHGGGGLPWAVTLAASEMWNAANLAFALCPLLNQGAVEMLSAHASEEQKALYLPKMIEGKWTGTMNLTEPSAGSDVGALKTRAVPQPDGTYRIKGQKIFITYGEHDYTENIIHLVLARTPDAPAGTKGISCFIVPKFLLDENGNPGKRNDLRCVSLEHKLGIHASPTAVMSYGDNDECVGYLIGEENRGMRYMFTMMNNARLNVGLQGLAIAERAYQQALDYARERRQGRAVGAKSPGPSPIIEHADVRRMLMLMKAQIEAMRMLIYTNASAIDFAHRHPDDGLRARYRAIADLLTPLSKSWSTDLGCEIASLGIQVHGGMGFIEETGAAQYYRDARITPIYEGTNGIQAADLVMRKLPMQGGDFVRDYIAGMDSVVRDLRAGNRADLDGMADDLAPALASLREATDWMLERLAGAPNDVLAGSVPYQRLFAVVHGGVLHGRSALAAAALLGSGGEGDDFYNAKLATAAFYMKHVLSEVAALKTAAMAGADLTFALSPDHLALGR